jgi:hypothetical protein
VSVYASPGAAGSSTSFSAYRCQSQDGCIRWYANNAGGDLYVNWWLQDSGGASFPTVQALGGNTNGSVFADNIAQADSSAEAVTVSAGFDYTKVIIRKVYSSASPPVVSDSGCIGPENLRLANWTTNGIASPWKLGWNTVWTGGLSTPHPGSNRAFGPVQARFTNLMPALDDWDSAGPLPTGITLTADGAAPDGTNTAIKVVADNTFVVDQVVIGAYPATLSASVGDHVFMGVWIKSTVGAVLQMSTFGAGDVEFDGAGVIGASRHIAQDGWQWCTTRATVTAITNGHYFLVLSIPAGAGTYYLFGPTVIVASDALAKDCDFFEYAGTAKHQPQYLTAGQQGTMEGQKFIADGGLGTNSANAKVVGAGSGQLTLTGTGTVYLPEYDRDGTTIIGWKAMLQATVNP